MLREDGIGSVVFAHKTTEGWEALLTGMIRGGWTITGSWPIATERPRAARSQDSAALATSVHLICRPRPDDAAVGDWADVLRELPTRVGDWMERLQGEGVRGADLVFACIGPALEIFSRYTKVETADGREVALAEYLEKVWEVVGRSALAQVLGTAEAKARNGAAGAVEEDARLTALFLWTLQSTDGEPMRRFERRRRGRGVVRRGRRRRGILPRQGQGLHAGLRCRAPVRAAARHRASEVGRPRHRDEEGRRAPAADRRAREAALRRGWCAGRGRAARAGADHDQPAAGYALPRLGAGALPQSAGAAAAQLGGVEVSDESLAAAREATTLDRVHAAMLLQAGGRTNALRALLKPSRSAAPTSCASPTPFRRSTRRAARRSDCSTRCCWLRRDRVERNDG